jgi:hypothetical protein
MNYLLLICSDGVPTPEKTATMQREIPAWREMLQDRGATVGGHELAPLSAARTVSVRDGETLVTDGPFAETKEFIGGFDVIECADLDDAIEIAARHPVSWFHRVEVRPFAQAPEDAPRSWASDAHGDPRELDAKLERPLPGGTSRYLLMMSVDGIPGTAEQEDSILDDGERWVSQLEDRGIAIYGHALAHADAATTVRVRDGETLLSDGPFAETKEFVGGFQIIECGDIEEAVRIASDHPLARVHRIEVRPLAQSA